MKHIVIDARELRTSSGRYVERMLHYLQRLDKNLGHRYTVLLKPKDMDGWTPSSKRFTKLACPYKEFTFAEQLPMLKQIRDLKADLVHFPFAQQPILYRGKTATTIQDLTTLRFTNPTKNLLIFKIKQWVYKWVIHIVAHKSVTVITPTEFVKDDVAKFAKLNSRKITVTLESADRIADTPTPLPYLTESKFIMYVGRPQPHKNLWRLIEAFQILQTTLPDLKLVLAGRKDAAYKQIERRVKSANIQNVVFTDFVSEGELRWLYENCQVYCFPSLSEGFGLPALEAMLHGAPAACSNATCLPEVYGDAVQYFDPLNVEDMAKNIGLLLKKPELRKDLMQKGKKQAAKYSWQRMAEQTLAVYKEALGEKV